MYTVYLLPGIIGLVARLYFFREWFNSPFHYYHTLVGLDMRKFLIYGEKFYYGSYAFSPYRLFIALVYGITGADILPEAVVIGQIILGLLTIILTVYVTLSISGHRSTAFIAGLFSALYAPVIIYETQILKASMFLFLSVFSLATLLFARKKHFSNFPSFLAGTAAILPFFVRHAGFLWFVTAMAWVAFYCRIKIIQKCGICLTHFQKTYKNFKPLLFFFLGSLAVLLVVVGINMKNGFSSTNYFLPHYSYLINTGADVSGDISSKGDIGLVPNKHKPGPTPSQSASKALKKIAHYATKTYYIFNHLEMPNNINYYFIQQKIPLTKFFIGPALLIPLALTGFVMMIFYGGLRKKESILFFYVAAFAIPICVFLPLGRYKLVLAPIFFIASAYTMTYMFQIFQRKKGDIHNILTPSLLAIFFFLTISTESFPIRRSDKKAYSLGAIYLPEKLMAKGNFKEAASILGEYYHKNPDNNLIGLCYASSLLGCNRPKDAEFILIEQETPKDANAYGNYFYLLGESFRMQGRIKKALKCYSRVIDCSCSEKLQALARKQMFILLEIK